MTAQHCTGCLREVAKDHKCTKAGARLVDAGTLQKAAPTNMRMKEVAERLQRIENKLDVLLAMADKRRKERIGGN